MQRCELNETRDERELKVVTVVTVECERDNQADLKMKTLFFYWILMYHTTCVPSVHVQVTFFMSNTGYEARKHNIMLPGNSTTRP